MMPQGCILICTGVRGADAKVDPERIGRIERFTVTKAYLI
jgi:hypothetical protein